MEELNNFIKQDIQGINAGQNCTFLDKDQARNTDAKMHNHQAQLLLGGGGCRKQPPFGTFFCNFKGMQILYAKEAVTCIGVGIHKYGAVHFDVSLWQSNVCNYR